jgi:hypothetical protein
MPVLRRASSAPAPEKTDGLDDRPIPEYPHRGCARVASLSSSFQEAVTRDGRRKP